MPRLTSFTKGATIPSISWLNNMEAKTHFRPCTVPGEGSDITPELGGVHRICCLVDFEHETSGGGEPSVVGSLVLDTEIDWRDRILIASYAIVTGGASDNPGYPGAYNDDLDASDSTVVGYTGSGGTVLNSDYATTVITDAMYIQADSTNGLLRAIFVNCSSPTWRRATVLLTVIATEQTGANSAPDTMPAIPYGGNGDAIEPVELNALQDGAVLSQMRDADATDPDVDTLIDEKVFPLGPAMSGDPGVPLKYSALLRPATAGTPQLMHRSYGEAPYRAREVRRQRVAGGPRLFYSATASPSTTLAVDNTFDWRDRMVTIIGRASNSSNIGPGESADTSHNAATVVNKSFYTGLGNEDETDDYDIEILADAYMYADISTGYLVVKNIGATSVRMTMMIYASFPLGPRSPRT